MPDCFSCNVIHFKNNKFMSALTYIYGYIYVKLNYYKFYSNLKYKKYLLSHRTIFPAYYYHNILSILIMAITLWRIKYCIYFHYHYCFSSFSGDADIQFIRLVCYCCCYCVGVGGSVAGVPRSARIRTLTEF